MNENRERKTLKQGDKIFLSEPKDYPKNLAQRLEEIFKKNEDIASGYLAEGFLNLRESPHIIVGIHLKEDSIQNIATVMTSLRSDLNKIIPKGLYIDFIEVKDNNSPVNDYFINCLIPFYKFNV